MGSTTLSTILQIIVVVVERSMCQTTQQLALMEPTTLSTT